MCGIILSRKTPPSNLSRVGIVSGWLRSPSRDNVVRLRSTDRKDGCCRLNFIVFIKESCYIYSCSASINMIVLEAKLNGTEDQYRIIDEMIRTGRFIRNSCLRYWMDNIGVGKLDLNKYCKVLSDKLEFPWASKLNSLVLASNG